MDNGFLRSAEPVPAGELRISHAHGSSYSYSPGLELYPDSLNAYNLRERRPLFSLQHPLQLEAGLGHGFSAGLQACFWLGNDYQFRGYEDTDLHKAPSISAKAFLQMSARIGKDHWLALTPAITIYRDIQIPQKHLLLRQGIQGCDIPLSLTKVTHHTDHKTSNSFTLRYSWQTVKGDLKVESSIPWDYSHQEFPDQPRQTAYRLAAIYTFNYDKQGKGRFFDLGMESTLSHHTWSVMPVFGIRWYSTKAH